MTKGHRHVSVGVDIISRLQRQNAFTSTNGRRGEEVISHQIRSTASHNDPWDIVTFDERHSVTAAFSTFHQSSGDFVSQEAQRYPVMDLWNLLQELISGSGYKWNEEHDQDLFFFFTLRELTTFQFHEEEL